MRLQVGECVARIGSYKNVYSQIKGAGKTTFSPTVANKWVRFCNNGTFVYKFNNAQFVRYFGQGCANLSSSACTRFSVLSSVQRIVRRVKAARKAVVRRGKR